MEQLSLGFSTGCGSLDELLAYVHAHPIQDNLVRGCDMYVSSEQGLQLRITGKEDPFSLHPNALKQICSKLHIPQDFITRLLSDKCRHVNELADVTFDTLLQWGSPKQRKFLLRSVTNKKGEKLLCGFLSSSYKRLDMLPILKTFSDSCCSKESYPQRAYRGQLEVAISTRKSCSNTEVGLVLRNSDFGVRALDVQFALYVPYLIIGNQGFRKIHLGKAIASETESTSANTKAACEGVREAINFHLDEKNLKRAMTQLQLAKDTPVTPNEVTAILKSLQLAEKESEAVCSNLPYHALPPENNENMDPDESASLTERGPNTRYELAASIAAVGYKSESDSRKLELAEAAGQVIFSRE